MFRVMYDLANLIYCPPIVRLPGVGQPGYLLAWIRHDRDGSWRAVVTWTLQVGDRTERKVIDSRAEGLGRIDSDAAYALVPRFRFSMDSQLIPMGPDEDGPDQT